MPVFGIRFAIAAFMQCSTYSSFPPSEELSFLLPEAWEASPPRLPISDICSLFRLTASPPLRPATLASSGVHWCATPSWCAALPPLLAISLCFAGSIEAKPRLDVLPDFPCSFCCALLFSAIVKRYLRFIWDKMAIRICQQPRFIKKLPSTLRFYTTLAGSGSPHFLKPRKLSPKPALRVTQCILVRVGGIAAIG